MKITLHLALVVALLCLASCATTGPLSAPIVAGAASLIAVFDQLLAAGVMDPLQHQQAVAGISALEGMVLTAQRGVEVVRAAQAGTLTTGEAATAAGGLAATVLGAIRVWRGPADKGVLAKHAA